MSIGDEDFVAGRLARKAFEVTNTGAIQAFRQGWPQRCYIVSVGEPTAGDWFYGNDDYAKSAEAFKRSPHGSYPFEI